MKRTRNFVSKSLAAMAIAAVLFVAPHAFAQSSAPGYITRKGGTTQYDTFNAANPGDGSSIVIHDGDVLMGGDQITYATNYTLTVSSDDGSYAINGNNASRFIGAYDNASKNITLNLTDVTLKGFKSSESGGVICQQMNAQQTTLNGTNATFSGNSAISGGVFDGFNITINGSNTFSGNSATGTVYDIGYGGAIYSNNVLISGNNEFTNNTATNAGGAIRATDITFRGAGSSAIFSDNTANGKKNDLSILSPSADDTTSVTIQDAGTYVFNGGITAAEGNTGKYDLNISNGANVTFGAGSITDVTGIVSLTNASLTIEGGTSTDFKAAGWAPSENSRVSFVHTVAQAGTVIKGDADKLRTLSFTPTVQLTGSVADDQFGYVSAIGDTGVTTEVTTGGKFNLLHYTSFLGSSATLFGSYGTNINESGDAIVVTADGKAGGALSFNSNASLTIYSNKAGANRTIDAEGASRFINLSSGNLTLHSQDIAYANGKASVSGGAIYAPSGSVALSGANAFTGNSAGHYGGAIYSNYSVTVSGTNAFTGNSAGHYGGAIYAPSGSVALSGTNAFTGNSVDYYGGAIRVGGDVSLSGTNTFTRNEADRNGGAIYANNSVALSGTNTFTGNSAGEYGGAIYAYNGSAALSGVGSQATFSGNTVNGVNNDIYARNGSVTIQDAGTYSFGGGLVIANGNLAIQDGANVTLESGSITNVAKNFTLSGTDANLNIALNGSNLVASNTTTAFANGATKLTVGGAVSITDGNVLNYAFGTSLTNGWYLAAVGNFSGLDDSISLENAEDFVKVVKKVNESGVWFGTLNYAAVYREDSMGELQNSADTFDGAFGDGLQALATGDSISIGSNVNSENEVTLGAGVTELSIVAAASGAPVTVTATGDAHRFLNVEDNLTLNLTNVTFDGGNAGADEVGGAILTGNETTLTINADNAAFSNNSAGFGGAIESNDLVLTGASTFSGNTAKGDGEGDGEGDGGAIDTWTGKISGTHEFTGNSANKRGGAIWALNLTLSGDDSDLTFSGNAAGTTANDIWIAGNGSAGSLTIEGNGTYELNGGIVAQDGSALTINDSATVTFGENAVNNISGLTTIRSQNVTFSNAQNKFVGGLVAGAGVNQAVGGNVAVGEILGVTFDQTNDSMSQIDFSAATDLTVSDGTNVVISDVNGNAMTAEQFKGSLLGTTTLVAGQGDALESLGGASSYESLLYRVQIGYGLDGSSDFVMESAKNTIPVASLPGNAQNMYVLYGEDMFDVPTWDDLQRNVQTDSREAVAHTGHAMVNKISYMNRMLTDRMLPDGAVGDALLRGQSGSRVQRDAWVSGYGLGANAQQYKGYSGYDYNAGGTLLGVDWRNDCARFGLYFGYGQTGVDSASANLNSDDVSFGATLRWNDDYGYTSVLAGFQFNNIDGGNRLSDGTGHSLDFDAWESTVYAERGIQYENKIGGIVNPYAALQYVSYRSDGFQNAEMAVGMTKLDSLQALLGLRLSKEILGARASRPHLAGETPALPHLAGETPALPSLQLTTGFAWRHEFLDASAFSATVGNNSALIYGNMAGRDTFEFTVGLGVDVNSRVNVCGNYYLDFNRYASLNAGMGTVTVKF